MPFFAYILIIPKIYLKKVKKNCLTRNLKPEIDLSICPKIRLFDFLFEKTIKSRNLDMFSQKKYALFFDKRNFRRLENNRNKFICIRRIEKSIFS